MTEITQQRLTGERALFHSNDLMLADCIFADGESPLKESSDLNITDCSFQWKYPLWYCNNVNVTKSTFQEMGRAGIWYTNRINISDSLYAAPKGFRRCDGVVLRKVDFTHAEETLWNCNNISINDVTAKGDYFGMGCHHLKAEGLRLDGNYGFDSCEDLEFSDCTFMTKDAFWNCKNVEIRDSYICGEYFGWNSENVTLINCTIESLQGFCYMKNVKLVNCKLLNTTLAFEYSTVDALVTTAIDSVKNPISGHITAPEIRELILDENEIDPNETLFEVGNV